MAHSHDEIFRQGAALIQTHKEVSEHAGEIRSLFDGVEEIVMVACGSSYWMSMSACMTIQEKTGIRCSSVKSGDVFLNPEHFRKAYRNPLVIAASRSGNTSETLEAVRLFRETYGSKVFGITEYPEAAIAPLCDVLIRLPWANETSVCQTRSFSNLYLACVLVAAIAGNDSALAAELLDYAGEADLLADRAELAIRHSVESFPQWNHLVGLGHGKQYGVCVEGVYIGIEMAQFPGNYYGTLEYRHGPIVTADADTLVLVLCGEDKPALQGNVRLHEEKMAADARAKGARVLSISDLVPLTDVDGAFAMGRKASPEVIALYGVMIMQGFAYWKALAKGVDPDNPADLVPYITL